MSMSPQVRTFQDFGFVTRFNVVDFIKVKAGFKLQDVNPLAQEG